jgi:AcrR family transcriptional regulator
MAKRDSRNTRGRIINAAWALVYEQGYEDTTIEEIIDLSHTSKGSFYHYFEGKDALLGTLSDLFDEKYAELKETLPADMHAFDKLMYLNRELFRMIENRVSLDLLARLISTQLITKGEKHLLDHNRMYYRLLRSIISDGQAKGELSCDASVNDIVKTYALCERALMYDWCLCSGEYSLADYAKKMLPAFLDAYRTKL